MTSQSHLSVFVLVLLLLHLSLGRLVQRGNRVAAVRERAAGEVCLGLAPLRHIPQRACALAGRRAHVQQPQRRLAADGRQHPQREEQRAQGAARAQQQLRLDGAEERAAAGQLLERATMRSMRCAMTAKRMGKTDGPSCAARRSCSPRALSGCWCRRAAAPAKARKSSGSSVSATSHASTRAAPRPRRCSGCGDCGHQLCGDGDLTDGSVAMDALSAPPVRTVASFGLSLLRCIA